MSIPGPSAETEGGFVDAGAGEGVGSLLKGMGRFGGDGKFLELDIGDGRAALRIVLNATDLYTLDG